MKEISDRLNDISHLRELADFLEVNPLVPVPPINRDVFVRTKEELIAIAKNGGTVEKGTAGDWFFLRYRLSPHNSLEINIDRDKVCERIVVGKKPIPEKFIPAHEEEIVEWKCPESLLV